MQNTPSIIFKGQNVEVRELTVKEVREIFEALDNNVQLFIDDLLDQPIPALIVTRSTGLELDQIEEATPAENIALCQKVAESNPACVSLIKRRIAAAERLEQIMLSN